MNRNRRHGAFLSTNVHGRVCGSPTRVAVYLLTVCVLVSLASTARAQGHIKVGAWNIENLGERQVGQDAPALAEHLRLAGIDVVALEEIHDTDGNPTTRRNGKLDQVFTLLNQQPGQDWEYVLFANRDQADTSQLCGVAWNRARVTRVGDPFRIPIVDTPGDGFNSWDRHPHAVKFSAGNGLTDFVVIPVHMKANTASTARRQRTAEARELAAQLAGVRTRFRDSDIIIIGDTNCLNANETALRVLTQAGFVDLNALDLPTFFSGAAPFDRALVPRNQDEFMFSRQYTLVPSDRQAHEELLSDHFLILTALRVMQDDDVPN